MTYLIKEICDVLEHTNLSMSDTLNCIDLSHHDLNDEALHSIMMTLQNRAYNDFDGITSIDLSNNALGNTDPNIIDELFSLIGQKFNNLKSLNLSNSGIRPSIYNDEKLESLNLFASITWFEYSDDNDEEDSFDFMDDDDSDDEDDDESIISMQSEEDFDAFIMDDDDNEDSSFYDDMDHETTLEIAYSLNLNTADSELFIR